MFDAYTRTARLAPAGLVVLPPLIFAGGGFLTEPIDAASPLGFALVAVGLVGSLIARSRGRRLQPALWASWGGSPTVRQLRWSDSIDHHATQRLHGRVQQVVDAPLPTAAEEALDPGSADRRYEEAAGELRELTRSADYPLVAAANMDYGLRRNLLGLRPIGLAVSVATTAASIGLLIHTKNLALVVPLLAGLAATVLWRYATEAWVRAAADDYATQLLGAAKLLASCGAPEQAV